MPAFSSWSCSSSADWRNGSFPSVQDWPDDQSLRPSEMAADFFSGRERAVCLPFPCC